MSELKLTSPISEEKQSSAVTRGQRLENGDRIGSFEVWRKLAAAMGTSLARLTADG